MNIHREMERETEREMERETQTKRGRKGGRWGQRELIKGSNGERERACQTHARREIDRTETLLARTIPIAA